MDAPAVDRKLKPKLHQDEIEPKLTTPNLVKSVPSIKSPASQPTSELRPPCIDRKLKPTTPIKVRNENEIEIFQYVNVIDLIFSLKQAHYRGEACSQRQMMLNSKAFTITIRFPKLFHEIIIILRRK